MIKLLCIIMKDEMVSNLSLHQLSKLDLNNRTSLKPVVELGCAATNLLANLRRKDLVDEEKVFSFITDCRIFAVKAIESFPSSMYIGSTFVKSMSCLNPHSLEKLGVTIVVKGFANIVHSLQSKTCAPTLKVMLALDNLELW